MIDKILRSTIFFLLFVTIIFSFYSMKFVHAEVLPYHMNQTIPGNAPTGKSGEMKIPETFSEEVPSEKSRLENTRGTSSLPEDRTCVTVDGKLKCVPNKDN